MKYKTLDEVWTAINNGVKVFWMHEGYEVLVTPDPVPHKDLYSHRNGNMLRVTYIQNWFGSRLVESELNNLYSL